MRLLVGLGNPGPKYAATRHNFGFLLLDEVDAQLAKDAGWELVSERAVPKLGRWKQYQKDQHTAHLLWPLTFMNLSGEAVSSLVGTLGSEDFCSRRDLMVAIDDLSLPLGRTRVRSKGSSGGHNGLKSIEAHLGHKEYSRIKLGIGRPEEEETVIDFVLEKFDEQEVSILSQVLEFISPKLVNWLLGAEASQLSQLVNGWTPPVEAVEKNQDSERCSNAE